MGQVTARRTYRQTRNGRTTAVSTLHAATIREYAESFELTGYTVEWTGERDEEGFTALDAEETLTFSPVSSADEILPPWILLERFQAEEVTARATQGMDPRHPEAQFARALELERAKGLADGVNAQRLVSEGSIADRLESMIDSSSLSAVLSLLAEVCHAKASHLEEAWQDASAAKVWNRSAARLETVANRIHEYGI